MSKKAKKAVQPQEQETGNSEESAPATIVEAGMDEVFPSQADGQEVGAAAKPKPSRRPYILFVAECLENGAYDRKELVAAVLETFPTVSKGGISTFVTDLRNPKYSHFKDRRVVLGSSDKLIFEDRVPAMETQPTVESSEKPAE